MNKKKNDNFIIKNFTIISAFFLIILLTMVVVVTYAVFVWSGQGVVNNQLTRGSFVFSYVEDSSKTGGGININNAMPISDEAGKKLQRDSLGEGNQGYFDFNISYTTTAPKILNYEIYLNSVDYENEISEDDIKIYLSNATTEVPYSGYETKVPRYSELENASSVNNAKRLYYGSFTNSKIESFRLRMWVSDDYVIDDISRKFTIKVNVNVFE